jgi:hypothetical protein
MSVPAFLVVPLDGEPDLPWDYFVLQAARGSVRVPDWVLLAVPRTVADRLGIAPAEVREAELEQALALLPPDPRVMLAAQLARADVPIPAPTSGLRLEATAALGPFRDAVSSADLLHDVAVVLQRDYGRAGFYAAVESLEDPVRWDARGAVVAMVYLMLLRAS